MEIQFSRNKPNKEGIYEITFKFIKDESDNNDFDLRMWRLNDMKIIDTICWTMFHLSKGNELSARAFTDEELKTMSIHVDDYKKKQIKDQKILTGMMALIGLVMVASPIINVGNPSPLDFWVASFGYVITLGSAVAYGLIGWEAKKKEEKEMAEKNSYQNDDYAPSDEEITELGLAVADALTNKKQDEK